MYISSNHIFDGLGPFLVTVHRPATFFRVAIDFYWISYEKSIHWNLIKMCHIPIELSDRDGALEAGGRRAAGNRRRHRLGASSGSFALVSERGSRRDAAYRSKCTFCVTTIQ